MAANGRRLCWHCCGWDMELEEILIICISEASGHSASSVTSSSPLSAGIPGIES
jgi:hypothetical protein